MKRYTPKSPRQRPSPCLCTQCLLKAQGMSPKQAAKKQLDQIERLMDKHGVAIQHVSGSALTAGFSYTVGMFLDDLPEFIVFGAPVEHAHPILNHLATAMREHDTQIQAGDQLEYLLREFPASVIGVDDPSSHLGTVFRMRSRRSHARRAIRALQIVLPDQYGNMPWEADYDWITTPLLSDPAATSLGQVVEMPDLQ